MHSYQSPLAEDTPHVLDVLDVPHVAQVPQKTEAKDATDVPNSAASHTYTTSGKIRRMPAVIRLQPYEQDTAILPILPIVASASEEVGQPYQNTYILDPPQTPASSAEIVVTLPFLVREAAAVRRQTLLLHPSLEKVLPPRNAVRALYIPPMILRSREPDEGEVLLGCCVLLIFSIIISCSLYYFLIHLP